MASFRKVGKKYYFRLMITEKDGTRKQKDFPGSESLSETKKMAVKKEAELQNTFFIKSSKMLLFDLLDLCEKETTIGLKESTLDNRQKRLKAIKKNFKNKEIGKIRKGELQTVFNLLAKQKLTKIYINYLKTILYNAFKYAIEDLEILKENPCTGIRILGEETKEKHIYTKAEYEEIRKFLFSKKNKNYYYFFIFGIKTGMRSGEIIGLKWENIDLKNRKITVKQAVYYVKGRFVVNTPKTEKGIREVYFDKEISEMLEEMKQKQMENKEYYGKFYTDSGYVFQQENGMLTNRGFTVEFGKFIREKFNIYAPIHSMRHTHITWLVEQGANIKAVQDRVGHKDIKTTLNVYTKSTENMKKELVNITKKF